MIEKLTTQALTSPVEDLLIDKLNEVIETVNTRPVIAECGCWTQGNCCHRCAQHMPKWMRETRMQMFGIASVPEAEPPEQDYDDALDDAIEKYAEAIRAQERGHDPDLSRVSASYAALRAAAHREYAQSKPVDKPLGLSEKFPAAQPGKGV